MCPVLRDMWGIYAVEVRYVSGVEGHVGRWGKMLGGGCGEIRRDCCGIVVTIRKSIRLFNGAGRRLRFWAQRK